METNRIKAISEGQNSHLVGLAIPWLTTSELTAIDAPYKVAGASDFKCYKSTGPGFVLASDLINDSAADVSSATGTELLADKIDTELSWMVYKSDGITSRRFGSVGLAPIRNLPTGTKHVGEIRVKLDLTIDELIRTMIDAEVSAIDHVEDEFRDWLTKRAQPLLETVDIVGQANMMCYLPVSSTDGVTWRLHDAMQSTIVTTPSGRVIVPSGPGVDLPADVLGRVSSVLDTIDLAEENSDISGSLSMPGVGSSYEQQVAQLNASLDQAQGSYSAPRGIGVHADDIAMWYYLLKAAFQQDDSIDRAVSRLGFGNLRIMLKMLTMGQTKAAIIT